MDSSEMPAWSRVAYWLRWAVWSRNRNRGWRCGDLACKCRTCTEPTCHCGDINRGRVAK